MSTMDVVRAWKDEEYRLSLSDTELAQLPENPVGFIELTDAQMASIGGGSKKKGGNVIINNVIVVVSGECGAVVPVTITNVTGKGK